ncbi:MAG TPA: sugar phosphate isomerase/epimerase [Phycicoccus sp.]|nr:sugar phosphate isomerase/epimerase [Phycicoccus sp.]HQH07963.1 sugar phosphate isomerase/epimerase [Phycicoccus sp.]HQK30913.1 sugar phosphate isomerase/epimerase [Phycicoccus sp.]
MSIVHVPDIPVALSTSSAYPETCAAAFGLAERLGYDAMEVMVWSDPLTQEAGALKTLVEHHGIPVVSIHAPTLLISQRVWGNDPWDKVDRSIELALELGARTVVVHPPFRWQKEYAAGFTDGIALRENDTGIELAVENMYPWRARRRDRSREMEAYLPHWDPVTQPYDHVTLDLSHTATARSDAMAMAEALGPRLTHVHLADGLGSNLDEHLVPGRGGQPCGEFLERLADTGFTGSVVVEVSTRKVSPEQREVDLAEALAFARLHLATVPVME